MKKLKIAGLSALTLLGSLATSQAQATTAPVGYVTLASASNPIPANSDARLCVPMEASVNFTGLATSATSNTITVSGATFTVNEFAANYFVRIKNGSSKGMTCEIDSNTADTLTVLLAAGDDLTNVNNSTQIEIVKYFTLSTFFPSTLPANTRVLFYSNETAGINIAHDMEFAYFGGNWYNTSNNQVEDAVLYPGEGFVLQNNAATPITDLVITGNVPTVSHRAKLTSLDSNQQDFSLSYLSPVSETINNTGLGFTNGDRLLAYDLTENAGVYTYSYASGHKKSSSVELVYFNSAWYDASNNNNVTTTFKLEPGRSYLYRKAAGTAGTTTWSNIQSYNK